MGFLSLNDSGTSMASAWGRLMPPITKNSNTLSSEAESLMPACMTGVRSRPPKASGCSMLSRAFIQRRLLCMVFISPLCPSIRNGCARGHVGKVFVLKRECTSAIAVVKCGCIRSGK